jgi:glycosyltransferase involved in cell wall biosynthesis
VSPDLVTVVVPVRDEEATIGAALESLAAQTIGPESIEVLVFDGAGVDATAAICRAFAQRYPWYRFEVLHNEARTVPHALNAGLAASTCPWFTRLDGRTRLSPGYLAACLELLRRPHAPAAAAGAFVADARGPVAESIAAAVTHPLGVGRGFRTATRARDVPHHPFAVWRTGDVLRLGGFDPELTRNQDDEFSMRAAEQGLRIGLVPDVAVHYRPRERMRGLAAQYFQYGLWKSAVAVRHGLFPKRSLAPAAVVLAAAGAASLALAGRTAAPAVAVGAGYAALGAVAAGSRPGARPLATATALATVHLCYGAGVIAGALRPQLTAGRAGRGRVR